MNTYSQAWFDTFLKSVPAEKTKKEVDFLIQAAHLHAGSTILDLCCGNGRHAIDLATRVQCAVGLDSNSNAIQQAKLSAEQFGLHNTKFLLGDMRDSLTEYGLFDAVFILWQSFGFFDAQTNLQILKNCLEALKESGTLILDIYNYDFFVQKLGERKIAVDWQKILESKKLDGDRLSVQLDYGNGSQDHFNWQIFTPNSIRDFVMSAGFSDCKIYGNFDLGTAPSLGLPRMQVVARR